MTQESRGGAPLNLPGYADRLMATLRRRHEAFGREFEEKMSGCKPGAESCLQLTGNIQVNGTVMRCLRMENDPLGCAAGVQHYVQDCKLYLERELKVHGIQALACFKREGFIVDELSVPVMQYAFNDGIDGKQDLLVIGTTGPGKTYSAFATLAHMFVVKKRRGLVVKANRLLSSGKWTDDLDAAIASPMLLLDDLGTEANTTSVKMNLLSLLDDRFNAGFHTIITSNLASWDAVEKRYDDERIIERLMRYALIVTSLPSKR